MSALLVATVLFPLLAGGALLIFPGATGGRARELALGVALATLAAALGLAFAFPVGVAGVRYASAVEWLTLAGTGEIQFALGLDGASVWLFALTPLLTFASIAASWSTAPEKPARYYGLILLLQAGLLGLFAAQDVMLFYVAFEFTLLPSFLLIAWHGGPERREAALTFVLYTLAGSLLTLVGVAALVAIHWEHTTPHVLTFSIPELTDGLASLDWSEWRERGTFWKPGIQGLVCLLLLAGFAVKTPIFPFHSWLPQTYTQAPTAVTILIAGAMSKLGAYGLLRFCLGMTPLGAADLAGLVGVLAVIGILYGALNALAQTDFKAMMAYSSLSHMGFLVLGLFALNSAGVNGATVQMVNHGVTTGALFLLVAVAQRRYGSVDLEAMGGLWNRSPLFAFFLIVACLSSAAAPGLNGFVGEFPILAGAFKANASLGVWASFGMILGAWYLIELVKRLAFGPLEEPTRAPNSPTPWTPLSTIETATLGGLTAVMILIGIRPGPLSDRIGVALVPIVAEFPATPPNELKPIDPSVAVAAGMESAREGSDQAR